VTSAGSRFEGKVAFVTGGASGLGAAAARRFAAEGARVAVADINVSGAETLAATLPDALAVEVDTAAPASVERAIGAAVAHYGRIDAIFNNAGIDGKQQPLHETEQDNWERVRSINGDGVFHVLKFGRRQHRQHVVHRRADRAGQHLGLHVHEGRHHRTHAFGGAGIRRPQHPNQRHRADRRLDAAGGELRADRT